MSCKHVDSVPDDFFVDDMEMSEHNYTVTYCDASLARQIAMLLQRINGLPLRHGNSSVVNKTGIVYVCKVVSVPDDFFVDDIYGNV